MASLLLSTNPSLQSPSTHPGDVRGSGGNTPATGGSDTLDSYEKQQNEVKQLVNTQASMVVEERAAVNKLQALLQEGNQEKPAGPYSGITLISLIISITLNTVVTLFHPIQE